MPEKFPSPSATAARSIAGRYLLPSIFALIHTASGGAQGGIDLDQAIEFKPGTPKARAMLARVASVRDLVAEDFRAAAVDLNDDGRKEILVMAASSSFCGSGGCALVVLEQQGNRMVTLLSQNVPFSLGVTKDKIGAYRALVALDDNGAVAIANKPGAPLHGKPMVYAMSGNRQRASSVPAETQNSPAVPSPVHETRSESIPESSTSSGNAANVVGIRLGMTVDDAEAALRAHAAAHAGTMQITRAPPLMALGPDRRPTGSPYYYTVLGIKNYGPSTSGVHADTVKIVVSPPPGVQRVVAVERFATFGNEQPVAPEAILDQLRSRHGNSSMGVSGFDIWFLDRNHRATPPPKLPEMPRHLQSPSSGCNKLTGIDFTSLIPRGAEWPNEFRDDPRKGGLFRECGTVLIVTLAKTHIGTVTGYRAFLMDHPAFIDAMINTYKFIHPQADAAKASEIDAARKRGAPKI